MTLAPSSPNVASTAAPGDMLDALLGVFSAKGFEGASLAELSRACDRSKASLYHHFPGGKSQMIEVLVRRCINDLDRRAFQCLQHSSDPDGEAAKSGNKKSKARLRATRAAAANALFACIDGFTEYLSAHNGHCLLATLALTQPSLLMQEQNNHLENWLNLLASVFERLGHKPKAARRAAHSLLSRLYGSLTLAAMGCDVPLPKACKWLIRDLKADLHNDLPIARG